MVWIHGGGNIIGGASAPFYDGRHFAAAGVVLVSIQYRLGAFGYLAHPALSAEAKSRDGREASGNYGLLDQIAALHWVQTNVGRFGGDKDRVTIFGESAGAANVTHLMASPWPKGYFTVPSPNPATSARTRCSSARGRDPQCVGPSERHRVLPEARCDRGRRIGAGGVTPVACGETVVRAGGDRDRRGRRHRGAGVSVRPRGGRLCLAAGPRRSLGGGPNASCAADGRQSAG